MDLRPGDLIRRLTPTPDEPEHRPETRQLENDEYPADFEPAPEAASAPPVRGGGRLPAWWQPVKPILAADDDQAEADGQVEEDAEKRFDDPADGGGEDEDRWWLPEEEDVSAGEEPADGAEQADEDDSDAEDDVPTAPRRRWGMHGTGKRMYARPSYYSGDFAPRRSLIEAWAGLRPVTRHGLYNGSALGLGLYLGVPQFVTQQTAATVAACDSWTDARVVACYFVVSGVWMFDYSTRHWLPPFALAARMPLVSLIVGLLLYGNPA
ncbi:hypothetical protein OG216_19575 [Streptomycetaceae bacterium NBC_01309]